MKRCLFILRLLLNNLFNLTLFLLFLVLLIPHFLALLFSCILVLLIPHLLVLVIPDYEPDNFANQLSFNGLPNVILDLSRVIVIVDRVNQVHAKQYIRLYELHACLEFAEGFKGK